MLQIRLYNQPDPNLGFIDNYVHIGSIEDIVVNCDGMIFLRKFGARLDETIQLSLEGLNHMLVYFDPCHTIELDTNNKSFHVILKSWLLKLPWESKLCPAKEEGNEKISTPKTSAAERPDQDQDTRGHGPYPDGKPETLGGACGPSREGGQT